MVGASNQSPQCEDEANTGAAFTDDDRDSTVRRESLASLDSGMEPNPEVKNIDDDPIYAGGSGDVGRGILDVKEAWQSRGRYAIRERCIADTGPSPLHWHSCSSLLDEKQAWRKKKAAKEQRSEGRDSKRGLMNSSPDDDAKCQDFGRRRSFGEVVMERNIPAGTLDWVAEKQNLHQLSSLTRLTAEHTEDHVPSSSAWIGQKQNLDHIMPSIRVRKAQQLEDDACIEIGMGNEEEDPSGVETGDFVDEEQQERQPSSRQYSDLQPARLRPGAYAINGAQIDETEQQANDGFPEHDISVVATLVDHDEDELSGNEPNRPSVVATAQRVKFGINFSDRRTWMLLCAVLLAFVGLAVGLTFGTAGQADGDAAGLTSNMGVGADGKDTPRASSQLPSSAPMIWPSLEPSSQPTLSTMPTSVPTGAPTSVSWELLGDHINGDGPEGAFGLSVSISTDGGVVGSSFQKARTVINDKQEIFLFPYIAKLYRIQWVEADIGTHGYAWTELVKGLLFSSLDSMGSFMSLSGDGSIAAIAHTFPEHSSRKLVDIVDVIADQSEFSTHRSFHQGTIVEIFHDLLSLPEREASSLVLIPNSSVLVSNSSIMNLPTLLSEDGRVLFVLSGRLVKSYNLNPDPKPQGGVVEAEGALSIAANGTILAVATIYRPPSGIIIGTGERIVKVFRYNDHLNTWDQAGSDFGRKRDVTTTAMSADGRIVAVGQPLISCNDCGPVVGQVEVYQFVSKGWQLMGNPIKGDVFFDDFGDSVSLSRDGKILAVGAKKNEAGKGLNSGLVRVYRYSEDIDEWKQVGQDMFGADSGEEFGTAVALSGDGRRLAVGAPKNRAGGVDAGRVSVFQLTEYS